MQPDKSKIVITDNLVKIDGLLQDLVLLPRLKALQWAAVTKQTPNMKIGYPGQHLASLVTGMPGTRTGARGHDLIDGSETKSCSRVDQLDKCNACGGKVMRLETICPDCDSDNIKRNDDSKWLFTIRSENDLKTLLGVPRVILALADYPGFAQGDFNTLSFRIFEIWPQAERHAAFPTLMTAYYESIYLGHKASDSAKTPAPKNFWPYSYQFYKCNPVLIFSATVKNSLTKPMIEVDTFVDPATDRQTLVPLPMPSSLLSIEELAFAINRGTDPEVKACMENGADLVKLRNLLLEPRLSKSDKDLLFKWLPILNEKLREPLSLRDTNKPISFEKKHVRT